MKVDFSVYVVARRSTVDVLNESRLLSVLFRVCCGKEIDSRCAE